MKPGTSSLNPYAASYIPLSKREGNNHVTTKDTRSGQENVWFESSHLLQNQHHGKTCVDSTTQSTEKLPVESPSAQDSLMQNPVEMIDKQNMDEEFDMNLGYLQMQFPGLSNQSLLDVLLVNNGDLEAAMDMLSQLEIYSDFPENLPDTLDIGDVPDSGSSATCAPLKLKNVAGEASTSSGSSEPAVVS